MPGFYVGGGNPNSGLYACMAGTLLRVISPALPVLILMVSTQGTPGPGHPRQVHIAHRHHIYSALFVPVLAANQFVDTRPPFPGWLLCHRLQLAPGLPRHSSKEIYSGVTRRVRVVPGMISGMQVMLCLFSVLKMSGEGVRRRGLAALLFSRNTTGN